MRLSSFLLSLLLIVSTFSSSVQADALEAGASGYVVKSEVTLLDMPDIVDRELGRGESASS